MAARTKEVEAALKGCRFKIKNDPTGRVYEIGPPGMLQEVLRYDSNGQKRFEGWILETATKENRIVVGTQFVGKYIDVTLVIDDIEIL